MIQKLDGWKKIIAIATCILIVFAGDMLGLDGTQVNDAKESLWVFLGAQGVADLGKYLGLFLNKKKAE